MGSLRVCAAMAGTGRLRVSSILLLTLVATVSPGTAENDDESWQNQRIPLVEIVFSFDTTGSMSSVIRRVRDNVADLIGRLQSDIPGIRIAVFANSDYSERYVTKFVDFTTDAEKLKTFVKTVSPTGGGDSAEAYEMVLREARTNLTWTPGSKRSLVMIGDEIPHEPSYRGNRLKINWRDEVKELANMNVKIYSVRALNSYRAEHFYWTMANKTGGFYLRFLTFNYIFDFLMAISYREYGLEFLEAFETEVKSRYEDKGEKFPQELQALFTALKTQQTQSPGLPQGNFTQVYIPPLEKPVYRPKPTDMDIYYLHTRTDIAFRFASTQVTSKLANSKDNATEAIFHIKLPEAAFITNFTIEVKGKVYVAELKEKEAAKKTYVKAKAAGKTAAHVAAQPKHTNSFKVSINVEGRSKVIFTMNYQELLERRRGLYEHVTHIDPGQVVRDLKVEIFIQESREITFLNVPPLRRGVANRINTGKKNSLARIEKRTQQSAFIRFNPSEKQQKEISEYGVYGQFVVQYDVRRDASGGEMRVEEGYFVHFFAPQGLPPLNKNVVFVLDTSGSMSFHKLNQLKRAMLSILDQLRPGDYFTMLTFSSFFRYWKDALVPVGGKTVGEAKDFIKKMIAAGGTNIYKALNKGVDFLDTHTEPVGSADPSMIIFLTDGQPTDGVTNKAEIIKDVRSKNRGKFMVFCLGFGRGVDMKFLQKIALENNGFSRRIYEEADADLQLKGFYSEVSLPLLANVSIDYDSSKVDENTITTSNYNSLFDGSEIVVAGQLVDNSVSNLISNINGVSKKGLMNFPVRSKVKDADPTLPTIKELSKFTERLWAYLTIKQMLRKALITEDPMEKAKLNNRSLELSLKYHFVTPLTSLVVVKPDEQSDAPANNEAEDKKKEEEEKKPTPKKPVPGPKRTPVAESIVKLSRSKSGERGRHLLRGESFGDGDPHFVVGIAGSDIPVCFDFTGTPGDVYSLLEDKKNGITVNGLWIVSGKENTHMRTYIGKIAIKVRHVTITVTPESITFGGKNVRWRRHATRSRGHVRVDVVKGIHLYVRIGRGVTLHIVRHLHLLTNPLKIDHLGFYVEKGTGLSTTTDGIIGQFYHRRIHVDKSYDEAIKYQASAHLRFKGGKKNVIVYPGHRRNSASKEQVRCWAVHNNGRHLLEKKDSAYQVNL